MNDACPLCGSAADSGRNSPTYIWFQCPKCKIVRFDEYALQWLLNAAESTLGELSKNASNLKDGWFLSVERNPSTVQTDGKNGIRAVASKS